MTRWFEAFASKVIRSNFWQQLTGDRVQPVQHNTEPLGPNEEYVERINLKDMPLSWKFLSKPTTIQEPTFKEVVALFRLKDEDGDANDESAIHIKTFRDIPLGDLDVIFPAQKILFKTVDFVRLGLTAVLGLYFALHAFSELFSDEGVDSTALAACIGFLAYASRTYWAIQWSVDTYRTVLSETLYKKSGDNHRGVILFLMEALEAQELKEVLISYVFALVSSGAITEKDLDTQAEGFIKEELEAVELAAAKEGEPIKMPSVDFEVDDAVDKLARLGLARVNGDKGARIIEAVPLEEAITN